MKWLTLTAALISSAAFANDTIFVGQTHGTGTLNVHDAYTGNLVRSNQVFGTTYNGGIFVAAADVNGDGRDDAVVGAGPGAGPHVRVFDGNTGALLRTFFAYDPGYKGGVHVASGDVNGDGYDDIATSTAGGSLARVRIFDGLTLSVLQDFTVAGQTDYWAHVWNVGGTRRILGGGSSLVSVFNPMGTLQGSFTPFGGFNGGVRVGSGDMNGDGIEDILAATASGAPPRVSVFNANFAQIGTFQPFSPTYTGGVSISTGNFDGDADDDFVCGTFNSLSLILSFDGTTRNPMGQIFQPYGPNYSGGVDVAYGDHLVGTQFTLTGNAPYNQVPITVWNPDLRDNEDSITPFTRLYGPGTAKFTAPQNYDGYTFFEKWVLDGSAFGGGQRTITVDTSMAHTLTPIYQPGRKLNVGSINPTSGIGITLFVPDEFGLKNGVTPFNRTYTQGTNASLNAPATFGGDKYFLRWNLNGSPWNSNRSVSILMGGTDRNLDAVYGTGFNVNVSANQPSVPITVYIRDKNGLTNGVTPFSRLYAPGTTASFSAPSSAGGIPFKYWILNGVNQPTGKKTVTVTTDLIVDISGYFAP